MEKNRQLRMNIGATLAAIFRIDKGSNGVVVVIGLRLEREKGSSWDI